MNTLLQRAMLAATLSVATGLAAAAPIELDDGHLDQVSAGGQYSIVNGGGWADAGYVHARARTRAMGNGAGARITKADLNVTGSGSGVYVYGSGESGAGNRVSGTFAEGYTQQGTVTVDIKTMAVTKGNGETMTRSVVRVTSVGSGSNSISARSY